LRQRPGLMNQAMVPRGPDEEGIYVAPGFDSGVSVRRLSIQDPEHGSEPLFNEDHSIILGREIGLHIRSPSGSTASCVLLLFVEKSVHPDSLRAKTR